MRWTRLDAGTRERLNDVVEDARGRWWIAGDVVRLSEDRGATWRVALEAWTCALAVDGDTIWAGGSSLYRSRDGISWELLEQLGDTTGGIVRARTRVYRVTTSSNEKADIARGFVAGSDDGKDWQSVYSIEWGYPGFMLAWGDELLVEDSNCVHRCVDDVWTRESTPASLHLWRERGDAVTAHDSNGRIWRSRDRGRTWLAGEVDDALTRLNRVTRLGDGSVLAVGEDGFVTRGVDDGTA